jgi:AcrR family transcriptional regulator
MRTPKRADRSAAMRKPKDPVQSRADILAGATQEFAERGFEGARLDAIAERTSTTRAMIYYYFGDREALYLTVLETAYRGIREAEQHLDLAHMAPDDAMRRLIEFVFDYYQKHPEFVALVVAENQAGGAHIRKAHAMTTLNLPIIDTLRDVLARGARDGVFRDAIDALDVHLAISALGFFQVANRHTFGTIFRRDLGEPRQVRRHRALVVEIVMAYLRPPAVEARSERRGRAAVAAD